MFLGLIEKLKMLARDEKAVTTLEYGILAAGVAVIIGTIMSDDGIFYQTIEELFERVLDALPTVSSGSSN